MAEGGANTALEDNVLNAQHQREIQKENRGENKMDAIDTLLERARRERLNELRQIQNNNRPVTGQDHRNNINNFLAKNLEVRETVEASGKDNVPLNTRNVEEHRPDAVVIEISNISQQQRVSSVLQTAGFRRHLENIIRGSIRSVSENQSRASSHQPSRTPAVTPVQSQTPVPENVQPTSNTQSAENERRDSISSRTTSQSSSSTSSRASSNGPVDYGLRIQDPRGLLGSVLNNIPAAPPIPPVVPPEIERVQEVNWHTIEEQHQEDLVQEISELVHRRLVTTTLEGDFRNVLELHVGQRLEASGTDGERVEQFIRSIPQSEPHVHNDFSNIGIPPVAENNWDNGSITSISATAVPYTQTNLHLSREVAALKAQLQEMKNMMKISFDLQMDIQRSIRQEVAAGIAAAAGRSTDNSGTLPTSTATQCHPVNDTHCLICLDNHSDSVLYQCGHMCVCFPCGRHLMDRGAKCPVCRAPIRDIIRAYKCNSE